MGCRFGPRPPLSGCRAGSGWLRCASHQPPRHGSPYQFRSPVCGQIAEDGWSPDVLTRPQHGETWILELWTLSIDSLCSDADFSSRPNQMRAESQSTAQSGVPVAEPHGSTCTTNDQLPSIGLRNRSVGGDNRTQRGRLSRRKTPNTPFLVLRGRIRCSAARFYTNRAHVLRIHPAIRSIRLASNSPRSHTASSSGVRSSHVISPALSTSSP